ncbi:MAG: DUF5676 family membrane protein [Gammaproteobacteria bacterium]|nr:DUF5676 family membrane protein [Gammaproteobacteria bacterium]
MIYPRIFGAACAVTAALLWISCSLMVVAMPDAMWQMTGQMLHVEMLQMNWAMNWLGFCVGLVAWTGLSGLAGLMLATIYNAMLRGKGG